MTVTIHTGDCRDVLATMPDGSVHCVASSPPYFGLRDYGVDGQIGLEPSPAEFVAELVAVFREVRRVLRDDGTLWLNLGDSYASNGGNGAQRFDRRHTQENLKAQARDYGLKPKDLIGIPWMVAFALRDDGWFLRKDNIWHKQNPMPESVRDRCTTAHEYLFHFSKSQTYYYDAEAIMEPSSPNTHARAARGRSNTHKWADGGPGDQTIAKLPPSAGRPVAVGPKASRNEPGARQNASFAAAASAEIVKMRNKRSVWSTTSEAFPEAHFATFPPALIEPAIKAGCPEGGTVLDPFAGAGTTGLVADRLGRDAVLIELNPDYADMARRRITGDAPLFVELESQEARSDEVATGTHQEAAE